MSYLAASVLVWVAIWFATAVVLDENGFDKMMPVLGAGSAFFVVVLPAALFRRSG